MGKWRSILIGAAVGAVACGVVGYGISLMVGRLTGFPADAGAQKIAASLLALLGALAGAVEGGTAAGCAREHNKQVACLQGAVTGALMGAVVAALSVLPGILERGADPGAAGEFLLTVLMGAFAGALIGGPAAVLYAGWRQALP